MNGKDHFVNHIAFCIDSSGSMGPYTKKTTEVFDACIKSLRESSVRWNQETRVSVYVFSSRNQIRCKVYDMDVTRVDSSYYEFIGQQTALLKATDLAFEDSKLLPQKYGDHAFIMYVLTDGEENDSGYNSIASTINESRVLGNYTWSVLVPNEVSKVSAERCGFPKTAIEIWNQSERGLEEVGKNFKSNMENYYSIRSQGLKATKNGAFAVDLSQVSVNDVKNNLKKLKKNQYEILINESNKAIYTKDLTEKNGYEYENGNCYYQLVKNEHIQAYKRLAIQSRSDDAVYYGPEARQMLGLPTSEIKVSPGDHHGWNLFVQSTAPNRNIIPAQRMLLMNPKEKLEKSKRKAKS